MRKPFQGIVNIIRFNWHFYLLAFLALGLLLLIGSYLSETANLIVMAAIFLIMAGILISLAVSFYIYDLSGLYAFKWIKASGDERFVVNIHAGFDETSAGLKQLFNSAELTVFDFYNPKIHTEVSIKRARKAYPPFQGTIVIETKSIPLENESADKIFVIFSAHEIRDEQERVAFFKELNRCLKPKGEIIVVEHLRDTLNFMAYSIGFFHFYSLKTWLRVFKTAELTVYNTQKLTPFISVFTLHSYGNQL
jgi:ubiquinone/menaquinone biosynthesis C-methylase UbiE